MSDVHQPSKTGKKLFKAVILLIIAAFAAIFGTDIFVHLCANPRIVSENDSRIADADCIIVLGAAAWGDEPSLMLADRLDESVKLYDKHVSKKIIMSGDHGTKEYDEVSVMKRYAMERGVPSENIFMDHAGFSTYETMYRAKHVFGAKKIVVVTQLYHLYRSVYIANALGLDAYGVSCIQVPYPDDAKRELREILARDKDVLKCISKPKPQWSDDSISLNESGDVTNDDAFYKELKKHHLSLSDDSDDKSVEDYADLNRLENISAAINEADYFSELTVLSQWRCVSSYVRHSSNYFRQCFC